MASRLRFTSTDRQTLHADRPTTVTTVAAVPASSSSGSMPPNSCRNASTGSPAATNISMVATRAASLPNTISRAVRSVASMNSRVLRSFSSVIAPATRAGVRNATAPYWSAWKA